VYCLEKSSIVLELPRGWKVVQLILKSKLYGSAIANRTPYVVAPEPKVELQTLAEGQS
jgi:hypothetical protein